MRHSSHRSTNGARRAVRAVLGIALALALGCGESEPPAAPQAEKGKPPPPQVKEPVVTFEQDQVPAEPARLGDRGTLPEDFPDDVPVYSGAESMSWMSSTGSGSLTAFDSDAAPGEVYDFYLEQLPATGWKLESHGARRGANDQPVHWSIHAVKGRRSLRLSIAEGEERACEFAIAVSESG